jgi:hypothetical protein
MTIGNLCAAGNYKFRQFLHFNKAHPTIARNGQLWVPAEMGNLNPVFTGSLYYSALAVNLKLLSINGYLCHTECRLLLVCLQS